jgi:hypothetical protein
LRRQRAVERLHGLGARVLDEFLSEIARDRPEIAGNIDKLIELYTTRLTPSLLRAVGGDCFPAPLLRAVEAGR